MPYVRQSRSSFPVWIVKNQASELSEDSARAEQVSFSCREALTALLLFCLLMQNLINLLHTFKWDPEARMAGTGMLERDLCSCSFLLPCFRHLETQLLYDCSDNPNRCNLNLNSQHLSTLFQPSFTSWPNLSFLDICLLARPLVKAGQLLAYGAVLKWLMIR